MGRKWNGEYMGYRPTMKIECAYGKSKAETKGYCLSKLTGLRVVWNLEAVCCVRFHETIGRFSSLIQKK